VSVECQLSTGWGLAPTARLTVDRVRHRGVAVAAGMKKSGSRTLLDEEASKFFSGAGRQLPLNWHATATELTLN
jgi:hypothetical protein